MFTTLRYETLAVTESCKPVQIQSAAPPGISGTLVTHILTHIRKSWSVGSAFSPLPVLAAIITASSFPCHAAGVSVPAGAPNSFDNTRLHFTQCDPGLSYYNGVCQNQTNNPAHATPCPTGGFWDDGLGRCTCFPGASWYQGKCQPQTKNPAHATACPPGGIWNDAYQQCTCEPNSFWNGSSCAATSCQQGWASDLFQECLPGNVISYYAGPPYVAPISPQPQLPPVAIPTFQDLSGQSCYQVNHFAPLNTTPFPPDLSASADACNYPFKYIYLHSHWSRLLIVSTSDYQWWSGSNDAPNTNNWLDTIDQSFAIHSSDAVSGWDFYFDANANFSPGSGALIQPYGAGQPASQVPNGGLMGNLVYTINGFVYNYICTGNGQNMFYSNIFSEGHQETASIEATCVRQ